MTYIELCNLYWRMNRIDALPPMCAALYFYLLHECNTGRWANPFAVSTRKIELELKVSRDAIVRARDILKKRGFLDFRTGKGRAPALYSLRGVKLKKTESVVVLNDNKTDGKADSVVVLNDNKGGLVVGLNDNKTDLVVAPVVVLNDNKTEKTPKTPINNTILYSKEIKTPPKSPAPRGAEKQDGKADRYQAFLDRYFDETRSASIEQLCMGLHIKPERFRELAREVVVEWRLSEQKHLDFNDAARHLVGQIRRKIQSYGTSKTKTGYDPRRAAYPDNPGESDWNASF